MVLRLRVAPRVWVRVVEADPDFDETLQDYLNGGASWIFNPPRLVGEKIVHLIESGNYRLWLARSGVPNADYDIIHMQQLRPEDHTSRAVGAEIDTNIIVLPPTIKQRDSNKTVDADDEPGDLIKPTQQIVFFLKIPTYRQLAEHVQVPLTMAYRRAKYGRSVQRLFWKDDAIFILTPDGTSPCYLDAAENLAQALEEAEAGRLITDPYEVRRALELADKFGEKLTGAPPSR